MQLRAGIYGTGVETFVITLNGSAGAPVRVMPFPGEAFAINCAQLDLRGSHTWLWNDTLCNAELYRSTPTASLTDGTDLLRWQDGGDGNKCINWLIHDAAGVGSSPQSETADHEANGNIIYNCGRSPVFKGTGAAGHAIYPHGTTTNGQQRKIRGNIAMASVGYGFHLFADTGTTSNYDLENNIGLDNGLTDSLGQINGFDYLIGGQTALTNLTCVKNVALRTNKQTTMSVGYLSESDPGLAAVSGVCTDNYAHGQITVNHWDAATLSFQRNTVVGTSGEVVKWNFAAAAPVTTGITADNNAYATLDPDGFGPFGLIKNLGASGTDYPDLASWRTATGFDTHSTFTSADTLGTKVFVFPSDYVAGRGHVAIDNPSLAASVAVDISTIVGAGQQFAIYHVYDLPTATNPGATPVLTGTYTSGTVLIPMAGTGKTPKAMPGGGFTPINALPALGAFLVVQTSPEAAPPPATPPSTPPTQPPPTTTPTVPALPSTPAMPGLFERLPVLTTAGEGWVQDLDYRLAQLFAALQALAQGNPGVPVDHLTVTPTSLGLTINTPPTTVPVDHVTVSPSSVTLTPPTQVQTGTQITHAGFGHTYFGTQPGATDLQWAEGAPLNRFGWTMSGQSSAIKPLFQRAYCSPYILHHFCEATGQEASDNNTTSWGTLATTWAQANGRLLEDLFLHAAVGQQNNVAHVASISATGLITLGLNPASNKQMLAQARAGVAASNAFQIGQTYTLTFTNPAFSQQVTVSSIPSQITIQTNYSGAAQSGTGGILFALGDGTSTFANRIFFESETDWAWATNPGSQSGKDFQVFRVGQVMAPTDTGVFCDSHSASNMHFQSVEYGTTSNAQYVNDISALFTLYRAIYPGTIYFPNISNFTTAQDAQMADAAGGCQQEGALNIFRAGRPNDAVGQFTVARLAAGTVVEIGGTPAFNSVEPHAGLSGLTAAQEAGGGHNYSTSDDRYAMTIYAATLIMTNQRSSSEIAAGSLKRLFLDPAGQFFAVFPLSARWETGFEYPLGEPTANFPPLTSVASGPDASGTTATVYARAFSASGSEIDAPTALVYLRVQGGNTSTYDATTAFSVPIQIEPPAGKTWGILSDTGTITGNFNLSDPVTLWNVDSVILVPH